MGRPSSRGSVTRSNRKSKQKYSLVLSKFLELRCQSSRLADKMSSKAVCVLKGEAVQGTIYFTQEVSFCTCALTQFDNIIVSFFRARFLSTYGLSASYLEVSCLRLLVTLLLSSFSCADRKVLLPPPAKFCIFQTANGVANITHGFSKFPVIS